MKKVIFAFFLFIVSCSALDTVTPIKDGYDQLTIGTKTTINDKPYFDADLNVWLEDSPDPYSVESFSDAYETLISSTDTLDRLDFSFLNYNNGRIQPTHYCLTIFPKNLSELNNIKKENDISISYFPFTARLVPEPNNRDNTSKQEPVFSQTRYYENITEINSTADDSLSETIPIPVLYVCWPISKTLPQDIDYKIDYEVFHPNYDGMSDLQISTLIKLENIALGDNSMSCSRNEPSRGVRKGHVLFYDNFMNNSIGQEGLKMRFQFNSMIWDTYTDENGYFESPTALPASVQLYSIFEDSRWIITNPINKATPINHYIGNVGGLWLFGQEHINIYPTSDTHAFDIHPYVYHYFHKDTLVTRAAHNYQLRITSTQTNGGNVCGETMICQQDGHPHVLIYENDILTNINKAGYTVLHELGHVNMFNAIGEDMFDVNLLFVESYACYSGWRQINEYYISKGLHPIGLNCDFGGYSGLQTEWLLAPKWPYTPFFIDLIDNYDQYSSFGYTETITNFPDSEIYNMIFNNYDWEDYQNDLRSYTSRYFTNGQFILFCAPYNAWFNN